MNLVAKIEPLFNEQIQRWDTARENYADLQQVLLKTLHFDGFKLFAQFNPKRIISSSAKVDTTSISERPCFLCGNNRPVLQQGLSYEKEFIILINPYPVFRKHLTVPSVQHLPQSIAGNFSVMLKLACDLPQYTILYNGPKCGASAPDHFHFQAIERGALPVESDFSAKRKVRYEGSLDGVTVYTWDNYQRKILTLDSGEQGNIERIFYRIYDMLKEVFSTAEEPMMNILVQYNRDRWVVHIIPRRLHRPRQYFERDEKQILLSPACIDMGGVLIMPRKEDFDKITRADIEDIFSQVCVDDTLIGEIVKKITSNP